MRAVGITAYSKKSVTDFLAKEKLPFSVWPTKKVEGLLVVSSVEEFLKAYKVLGEDSNSQVLVLDLPNSLKGIGLKILGVTHIDGGLYVKVPIRLPTPLPKFVLDRKLRYFRITVNNIKRSIKKEKEDGKLRRAKTRETKKGGTQND